MSGFGEPVRNPSESGDSETEVDELHYDWKDNDGRTPAINMVKNLKPELFSLDCEPQSYCEALNKSESRKMKGAIRAKLKSIE